MRTIKPEVIEHVRVCGNQNTYCAHPITAGEIFNFGNGEIACMHWHSECDYSSEESVRHGQLSVHGKAKVMLDRSFDGGRTWRDEDKSVVFDYGLPVQQRREILSNIMTESNTPPLTDNTIFHFDKSYSGEEIGGGRYAQVPFALRSEDKGHTWSREVAKPTNIGYTLLQNGFGIIRQGQDLYKPFMVDPWSTGDTDYGVVCSHYSVLYKSDNAGVDWYYVSDIARDPLRDHTCSYCSVVDLGNRHFLAVLGCWRIGDSWTRWINTCHSYDNGLNWTPSLRIQNPGVSPYPLVLRDGRIVVIFARRWPTSKRGIYGIVSGDEGKTWSDVFVLRCGDASSWDIGYPVATQLENGEIFTAYYYTVDDGRPHGGPLKEDIGEKFQFLPECGKRHVAGTIFRI